MALVRFAAMPAAISGSVANLRTELALLLAHGTLQRRILEPPAKHTDEKEVLTTHCAFR